MTEHRYNRPEPGTTDWHEPLNENFRDLDAEVVEAVQTWADLPDDPEAVEPSSNGQWPRFYVVDHEVTVRVSVEDEESDDERVRHDVVGGLGSQDHPLPEVTTEAVDVDEVNVGEVPVDDGVDEGPVIRQTPPRTGPYHRVYDNPEQPDGNMHRHFYDVDGGHVGSVGFHTHRDSDNPHWKVYTRRGTTGSLYPRLQIGAGADDEVTRFGHARKLEVRSGSSDVTHELDCAAGQDTKLQLSEDGTSKFKLRRTGSQTRLINTAADGNPIAVRLLDGGSTYLNATDGLVLQHDGQTVVGIHSAGAIDCNGATVEETGGVVHRPRGAPTTSELPDGQRMTYVSDGSDGHDPGDLVSARNDGGTIRDQVLAAADADE